MQHGLWDDIRYVTKFWREEMNSLLTQSRKQRGHEEREEEDEYDSDESDEEEGRVYFDCVEARLVDGEE